MKFSVALKKFFGLKGDQTLSQFLDESRKLTPADKAELKPLLEKELGIVIEDEEPKA
jgi:hypothetical protein